MGVVRNQRGGGPPTGTALGEAVDANQTVTGTTAETIAHTFTIPAGALTAGTGVDIVAHWQATVQGSSPPTTIGLKLGGTSLVSATRIDPDDLRVGARIIVNSATSQTSSAWIELASGAAVTGMVGTATTVNLSTEQTLTLVITPGATSDSWTLRDVSITSGTGGGGGSSPAAFTTYLHANDCTGSIVIARESESCYQLLDLSVFVCTLPAAGGLVDVCDEPEDWSGPYGASIPEADTLDTVFERGGVISNPTSVHPFCVGLPGETVSDCKYLAGGLLVEEVLDAVGNPMNQLTQIASGTSHTTEGPGHLVLTAPLKDAPTGIEFTLSDVPRVIDRVTTNTTFSNTAAQQTLVSLTVPGNLLGSTHCVDLVVIGSMLTDTAGGGSVNITWNLLYDDTATDNFSMVSADATTLLGWRVMGRICADGATNAQDLGLFGTMRTNTTFSARGVATEDSTTAKTIQLRSQFNIAEAGVQITVRDARLTYIP